MMIGLVGWGDWMDGVVAPCSGQWVIDRIVLSWSTYNILLHITIEYIDSSCVLRRRLPLSSVADRCAPLLWWML